MIKGARNVQDLVEVHAKHGAAFNCIHLSAFWNALGRLSYTEGGWQRRHAALLAALRQDMHRLVPDCGARELSSVSYGMAKAAPARGP